MSGLTQSGSSRTPSPGLQPVKTEPMETTNTGPESPHCSLMLSIKTEPEDEPTLKHEHLNVPIEFGTAGNENEQITPNTYEVKQEPIQEHAEFSLNADRNIKEETVIGLTEVIRPDTETLSGRFETQKLLQEQQKRYKRFPCDICGQVYQNIRHLSRHKLTHFKERPFICNTCNKGFAQKEHLVEHIGVHTKEGPYPCDVCQKLFSAKSQMKKHRLMHSKSYVCDSCETTFADKSDLKKHLLTHADNKPLTCDLCSRCFFTSASMDSHTSKYHSSENYDKCRCCSLSFPNHFIRDAHMQLHHPEFFPPFKCDVCGQIFNRRMLFLRHQFIHSPRRSHICPHCKKAFMQKPHLTQHMRIHTGPKPYKCDICSECFRLKSHLKKHRLLHNKTNPNILTCNVCKKKLNSTSKFLSHKRRLHRKSHKYICDICFNGFLRPYGLARHMLTHSNHKQFACGQCDKTFAQKPHLDSHQLVHTGAKPFECDTCGKCFTRKTYLNTHKRCHTGHQLFPCRLCHKTFTRKSSLNNHSQTHKAKTESKQIKCSDCDRKFSHKYTLRHHINQNHRPARYICDFCDKPFYYKSDHDRHKRTHRDP